MGLYHLSQAAEPAGYTTRNLIGLLAGYEVTVFDYSEIELKKDILNAQYYYF